MMMNHLVIIDVGSRGGPAHASSVVKVLAGAGQATAPGRSIKQKLPLRYATHQTRRGRNCGCRAKAKMAKAIPTTKTSSNAVVGATGVRATAWGGRIGRASWGPSVAGGLVPQPGGISHKPLGGRQRRSCGHSKRRACRTAQPVGEPRATGLAVGVRSSRCGLGASLTTEPTPEPKTPTGADYKPARMRWRRWPRPQASLKPYWGKPAVRNSRGGQRKRSGGSDGHLPRCPKGRIHWKPLTYSCSRLCSTRW